MIVPSKHSLSSGALTVCHFYIVISVIENKIKKLYTVKYITSPEAELLLLWISSVTVE